jgi:hypothetical protein
LLFYRFYSTFKLLFVLQQRKIKSKTFKNMKNMSVSFYLSLFLPLVNCESSQGWY